MKNTKGGLIGGVAAIIFSLVIFGLLLYIQKAGAEKAAKELVRTAQRAVEVASLDELFKLVTRGNASARELAWHKIKDKYQSTPAGAWMPEGLKEIVMETSDERICQDAWQMLLESWKFHKKASKNFDFHFKGIVGEAINPGVAIEAWALMKQEKQISNYLPDLRYLLETRSEEVKVEVSKLYRAALKYPWEWFDDKALRRLEKCLSGKDSWRAEIIKELERRAVVNAALK